MHPYLPHQISDITNAHRTEILKEEVFGQNIEEYFEAIHRERLLRR